MSKNRVAPRDNLSWSSMLAQYGVGAFETMRSLRGKIPLWKIHRKRMTVALQTWGVQDDILDHIETELLIKSDVDERVKLLMGLDEELKIIYHIYRYPLKKNSAHQEVLLYPFEGLQQNYKSCNYERHFLAHQKALAEGLDDAIYFNSEGKLLECTRGSLFLMSAERGVMATGPVLDSVLKKRLLDIRPSYWSEGALDLAKLPREGYELLMGNALHGLLRIAKITDGEGKVCYSNTVSVVDIEHWNRLVFSI